MEGSKILTHIRTKCCNDYALEYYNHKDLGNEQKFYCCGCDKELNIKED